MRTAARTRRDEMSNSELLSTRDIVVVRSSQQTVSLDHQYTVSLSSQPPSSADAAAAAL